MGVSMKSIFTKFCLLFLLIILTQNTTNAAFNTLLANKLQRTLDSMVAILPNTKGMNVSVNLPGREFGQVEVAFRMMVPQSNPI